MFEEGVPGRARHRRQSLPSPAPDRDVIVNAQGYAEAVEARSEIGSACGDTHGELLHSYAADTRPLTLRRERDRGSVATPRLPATHPLRHTYFETSRWSTDTK